MRAAIAPPAAGNGVVLTSETFHIPTWVRAVAAVTRFRDAVGTLPFEASSAGLARFEFLFIHFCRHIFMLA